MPMVITSEKSKLTPAFNSIRDLRRYICEIYRCSYKRTFNSIRDLRKPVSAEEYAEAYKYFQFYKRSSFAL